jgi:hypothetical protein
MARFQDKQPIIFLRINGDKHKNTICDYKMCFKIFSEDFTPDKAYERNTNRNVESRIVRARDNTSASGASIFCKFAVNAPSFD